ncbi:ribosome maturation factor RimM [Gottfriedia acidiceleris]|uniref:ribosome maturation factor RimM n=1 Tax=Bacillaceae TaxID=186817 RepID=UPI000BEDF124|nr:MULTISPECIES: ribosome maturation factor RimM [unclassified Bacillus (in: firmicutes)]PEC49755.1 ribosome maturation factor RimM [Bacillus sp. AFS096315]PFM79570.1 ribosome maturation factor RimM [Bacillus sp. AFS077874]
MKKYLNVGKIVNTHGVRGEVRVISRTDFPEKRYVKGNTLYFFKENESTPIELIVTSHRVHKNFDLLTFEGYESLNSVEPLKNGILKITEDQLHELDKNEYYYHEIIGCVVETIDGEGIGKIKEILSPGANDVWVIQRKGQKDALIPYIEQIVKEIDVANKKVKIELMEGLL